MFKSTMIFEAILWGNGSIFLLEFKYVLHQVDIGWEFLLWGLKEMTAYVYRED